MKTTLAESKALKRPVTLQRLETWAGAQTVRDARLLVEQGYVLSAAYDPPYINGTLLHNGRSFKTRLRVLPDGNAESECPCYANRERGLICAHVIALGLVIADRQSDPERDNKREAERRRARRLATIDESRYLKRKPLGTPGSTAATVSVILEPDWMDTLERAGEATLTCLLETQGKAFALDAVPTTLTPGLDKANEALLFVLEDICEGPARGKLTVQRRDFMNLLHLLAGRSIVDTDRMPVHIHREAVSTRLRLTLDEASGDLGLHAITDLPRVPDEAERFTIAEDKTCWVYAADHFFPVRNPLPKPYHDVYDQTIRIQRPHVLTFMQREWPLLGKIADLESELSLDMFEVEAATPRFRLEVHGSPASLSAILHACYEPVTLIAGRPDAQGEFAIPDPDDVMRYRGRNPDAERDALQILVPMGLRGESGDSLSDLVGSRQVLNFLGGSLPALRRRGWQIDLHGKIGPYFENLSFATAVVDIASEPSGRWFDVGFTFESGGSGEVPHALIHDALRKGDAWIEFNGNPLLIDTPAVESMMDVFNDCSCEEADAAGYFRLSSVYTPFVKASLDALDGIDVEAEVDWLKKAERTNREMRIEPFPLPASVETILRPYQKEGVYWLRFLENHGFCGLLADEMGLGKTLQTLTWLQLERTHADSRDLPALVVCPTSLVQNWIEEAARFAPSLRVCAISGAQRHEQREQIDDHDLVITSYALLRRDIEYYLDVDFSVVVLDEAQHIKNHSTQNAQAAKQIRAHHKLVLTGTPVENGVSDIWSIMDFLMPGYLGRHELFRGSYEQPIARGGPEAEDAKRKLRRKLHPFLLRRLKKDVAKELPPKIQSLSTCELTSDQRKAYQRTLAQSRQRISTMVKEKGFNRSRMEILTTLLKLRQICCHLELLKPPVPASSAPSSKMSLFLELVDEAIDGGHRILVFSQFVSMLKILRRELETRGIGFCYLDGSTKDRMQQVHRFNTDPSQSVFLISLKAGGTGLNLTGADMVIHYDPWWNPAVENQATDRAYRIGQKRTVYSVKLITKGTIEEKVVAMQQRKSEIINATVESDEAMAQSMTWDDVRELLEL